MFNRAQVCKTYRTSPYGGSVARLVSYSTTTRPRVILLHHTITSQKEQRQYTAVYASPHLFNVHGSHKALRVRQ